MHSSKLLTLLSAFKEDEWRTFESFLKSPYFSNNANLISLFKLIKKRKKDLGSRQLLKEKVSKSLFGTEKYNDKKMRVLMSDLVKQIQCFWEIRVLQNSPNINSILTQKSLIDHNLNKHQLDHFNTQLGLLNAKSNKGEGHY